jgi:hypothetical protein
MPVTQVVNRKELVNILKLLLINNKNKDVIDGMEMQDHFCFNDSEIFMYDGVVFSSANYETGISGGVEYSMFLKFIESLVDDEIVLTQNKNKLIVSDSKSNATFSLISADEFIIPNTDNEDTIYNGELSDSFFEGIKLNLVVADKTTGKYNNLFFVNDDKMYITASDSGKLLSYYEVKDAFPVDIVLPYTFCKNLLTLYNKFDKCEVSFDNDEIAFVFDDKLAVSTAFEDQNSTGQAILNAVISTFVEAKKYLVDKPELFEAILKQVNIFNSEKVPFEKCSENILISVINNQKGSVIYENSELKNTFLNTENKKHVFDINYLLCLLPYTSKLACFDTVKPNSDEKTDISVFAGTDGNFKYIFSSLT